jgi:carboxymethylenebutenolidase
MSDPIPTEYLALPAAGRGPGVLVLHAWWGLTGMIRELCDRLAAEGYVALAPDLYNGKIATTVEEAEKAAHQLDPDAAAGLCVAALERLRRLPAVEGRRTAVIGFSLGANFALWLANRLPADVAALIVFYGTSGIDFDKIQAAVLGHFAERDPYEPAEGVQHMRDRLQAAGREVTFYTYPGTGHWFFEQDRPDAYNSEAARLAWERTLEFLARTLQAEG